MANLVRFDWAIKKLLRNKANFGILEGFLTELLGMEIKVEQILESEGNKQDAYDKFNRVDILVRTDNDELMLVEVQNEPETDYFHRILYGTSKLVTEYLKEGEGYGSIRKIVSISIVYFALGEGEDYVYEYKGEFIGKHTQKKLTPRKTQKRRFQIDDLSEILPRYYILKINNFNDIAKDTLDEWIYFLKNNEVPENFKAKGLKEVSEQLRVDKLSDTDRKDYQKHKENRWIERDVIQTAENTGREQGIEIGIEQNTLKIAKNAIKKGFDNQTIIDLTGLTIEIIEKLRNENN